MGAHPRDPWSISAPLVGAPVEQPIRVAMVPEPPGGRTDPAVAKAVRRAGAALLDAGYDVVEVTPPRYADAVATWRQFLLGDLNAILDTLLPIMGQDGASFLAAVRSPLLDGKTMSLMLMTRHAIARDWSQFLARHPLVLTPTWAQLPFENGFDVREPEATLELMRPVAPANLLGLPSACVPAGRDEPTGLPVGVIVTGGRFREDLCLDAAEAIEQRLGLSTPIDPVDHAPMG
jgi:amidase